MTDNTDSQMCAGQVSQPTIVLNRQIASELLDKMPQDEWLVSRREKIIDICGYNGYDAPMVVELLRILEK